MKLKRRTLITLIVTLFALLAVAFCLTACGDNNETGYLIYSHSEGEKTIIEYRGKITNAVIPEKYDGYPVTSIDEQAFRGCTSLKSITIPDSVTYIGASAFA